MASYTFETEDHAAGCSCCRFTRGVDLPIPKLDQDIKDITALASNFTLNILKDWTTLNAILKRFEGAIQKRWMRKSTQQRRALLLQVCPEIPKTHRPDFLGFRSLGRNIPRSRSCQSNAFLWPYINLEDLCKPHLLLIFLNSRGRTFPDHFVAGDIKMAHLGSGWYAGKDEYDDYAIRFFGRRTPRTYGQVASLKDLITNKQAGKFYHPRLGLLACEIQHGIYSFLVDCAKLILHDITTIQYSLSPHQPEPPLPIAASSAWPSMSDHMTEAPYRTPEKLDLERLRRMVQARRSAAEDHLYLLREDPGYFLESIKEWKEHDEAFLQQHKCDYCWCKVAEKMINDAFTLYLLWNWIFETLTKMAPIEEQLFHADHDLIRLREKDEMAWVELVNVIDYMLAIPLTRIAAGLPTSPRMRHCFDFSRPFEDFGRWHIKTGLTPDEKRVDILFDTLCNRASSEVHSRAQVAAEIQYMLDTETNAGGLVDEWVTNHFADLCMLSELHSRISGFEPWGGGWVAYDLFRSEAVLKKNSKLFALELKMRSAVTEILADPIAIPIVLGNPMDGKFDYPVAKKYTEDNVRQMRCAEGNLDRLWEVIDEGIFDFTRVSVTSFLKRRLLEPRERYRTPAWVKPAPAKKATPKLLRELDANIPFGSVGSHQAPVTPTQSKVKVKTRGEASSSPPVPERLPAPEGCNAAQPVQKQIKVPKRAYKVLAALLPDPTTAGQHRGEISWEEFLQAMDCIGFQPQKLYGSVWIFMPKGTGDEHLNRTGNRRNVPPDPRRTAAGATCLVEAKRSIQFHEPREVRRGAKIGYHMVRTIGRRLKRAFGWEEGMFVCG